jgi:hypothetical protein
MPPYVGLEIEAEEKKIKKFKNKVKTRRIVIAYRNIIS